MSAVYAALRNTVPDDARVESYRSLAAEIADVRTRREQASHLRGEKASDRK